MYACNNIVSFLNLSDYQALDILILLRIKKNIVFKDNKAVINGMLNEAVLIQCKCSNCVNLKNVVNANSVVKPLFKNQMFSSIVTLLEKSLTI